MSPSEIQPETTVEDLVGQYPEASGYLFEKHGLRLIRCGEPVWDTIGELASGRGLDPARVVEDLRAYLAGAPV